MSSNGFGSFMIPPSLAKESKEVCYRDYSVLDPPQCLDAVVDNGRGTTQTFPRKLHYLLEYARTSNDGLKHIVSWQPHGRSFMVHDTKEFVAQVLPNWFMQSKLPSFQRQCNLYGFKRFTTGTDKGGYYHEFFLRGRPDLALHIKRTKVKGEGHRKAAVPESEPNFYRQFPLYERESPVPSTSVITPGPAAARVSPALLPDHTPQPSPLQGHTRPMVPLQERAQPIPLPEQTQPMPPLQKQAQPQSFMQPMLQEQVQPVSLTVRPQPPPIPIQQQQTPPPPPPPQMRPIHLPEQQIRMQESSLPVQTSQMAQLEAVEETAYVSDMDVSAALSACCTDWIVSFQEELDAVVSASMNPGTAASSTATTPSMKPCPAPEQAHFSAVEPRDFCTTTMSSLQPPPPPMSREGMEPTREAPPEPPRTPPDPEILEDAATCSNEAKPKDLDSSLLLMGQQQRLFLGYQPSSPQSLASTLCYNLENESSMYQNHDIIVDALRASAPFYPDIKRNMET